MRPINNFPLFEAVSPERQVAGVAGWWQNIRPTRVVYSRHNRRFQQASDLMLLGVGVVLALTTSAPVITLITMELLFATMYALLLIARALSAAGGVMGLYLVVIALAGFLNLAFTGQWGTVFLYNLCVVLLYRFPVRWALPLAGLCIFGLVGSSGAIPGPGFLPQPPQPLSTTALAINVLVALIISWVGWTLRTQYLLMVKLEEVQAELRVQMRHNEELATERERTRIARDIHDVLSHSLAVLSIQVQATRGLVVRDPERASHKLDEMAALIRESISESRQVIGLLRDKPVFSANLADLGASLQAIAATFEERTGMHCCFEQSGKPQPVSLEQSEMLHLGLREILTNAHRHGAAKTARITLSWQPAGLLLEVYDDGENSKASGSSKDKLVLLMEVKAPLGEAADKARAEDKNNAGNTNIVGHHGLQGMRERAAALGGKVEASPAQTEQGGFLVKISLPFELHKENSKPLKKEKQNW